MRVAERTRDTPRWDQRLTARAREAVWGGGTIAPPQVDPAALEHAYRACARITAEHSFTVRLAAMLLPPSRRRALQAMYAFARISDDLSELQDEQRHERWALWRGRVHEPSLDEPVSVAWADTCRRFGISSSLVDAALDGLGRDLDPLRNQTFDDVVDYAFGVSCTFCLFAAHIAGFTRPEAIDYAARLGIGIQLTNLLRDVGEDMARGCFYLPLEELHAFGLDESDVLIGRVDERWRRFMRFQIARAREVYRASLPGIALLSPAGRFALGAVAELYLAVFDDIEARDYDVFCDRAGTSRWDKLRRLPGIFARSVLGRSLELGRPGRAYSSMAGLP